MIGRHPIAVINISLLPQEVDVNVHPTKNEVRFRNERDIFSAVQKAVRVTLTAQAPMPTLDTLSQPQPAPTAPTERLPAFDVRLGEAVAKSPVAVPPQTGEPVAKSLPILRVVGQMANTYVIAEGPDGMYLIDQHAAHERVLFERIRNQRSRRAVEVQGLLQPVPVELTVRQQELLALQSEALSEYGFGIEHFGERTCLVRSVPAVLRGQNVAQSLVEVLDFLAEGEKGDRREEIAISLACHGAVRAGQALSHEEMRDLIRQLEQASQPRTCPHGRPTMIHLSASQLEKGFGRR
jgi:DNA mismatch repair protein MutL